MLPKNVAVAPDSLWAARTIISDVPAIFEPSLRLPKSIGVAVAGEEFVAIPPSKTVPPETVVAFVLEISYSIPELVNAEKLKAVPVIVGLRNSLKQKRLFELSRTETLSMVILVPM